MPDDLSWFVQPFFARPKLRESYLDHEESRSSPDNGIKRKKSTLLLYLPPHSSASLFWWQSQSSSHTRMQTNSRHLQPISCHSDFGTRENGWWQRICGPGRFSNDLTYLFFFGWRQQKILFLLPLDANWLDYHRARFTALPSCFHPALLVSDSQSADIWSDRNLVGDGRSLRGINQDMLWWRTTEDEDDTKKNQRCANTATFKMDGGELIMQKRRRNLFHSKMNEAARFNDLSIISIMALEFWVIFELDF